MSYTVMGVTAGRKNSNCEILLKEALLECRKQGAEVRMINLKDYNIIDSRHFYSDIPSVESRECRVHGKTYRMFLRQGGR